MLPFYKVFSLFIRVFARPIISKTKSIHLSQENKKNIYMRKWFIWLGNWFSKMETKVNRKFMRIETKDDFFVRPLSDEMAIEKGVEFFYECIIYSILIGLPIYELYRAQIDSQASAHKQQERLAGMQNQLQELKTVVDEDQHLFNEQLQVNKQLQQNITGLQQQLNASVGYLKENSQQLTAQVDFIKQDNEQLMRELDQLCSQIFPKQS